MSRKLEDLFAKNKYTKWYLSIIASARSRSVDMEQYLENHHVVPKSLGGSNDASNLVRLTAKEHFLVHLLLIRMVTGNDKSKMVFAFGCMSRSTASQTRVSSRMFSVMKRYRTHTDETKQKISEANRGRKQTPAEIANRTSKILGRESPIKGKLVHTTESKSKISKTQKELLSSMTTEELSTRTKNSCSSQESWTESRKNRISAALTGIKRSESTKEKISNASKNRSLESRLRAGDAVRGRTWKVIDGKRVWIDKETKN